jgi:predicted metalloprotease with PDZ domain
LFAVKVINMLKLFRFVSFLFISHSLFAQNDLPEVKYQFFKIDIDQKPAIKVKLNCKADQFGRTILIYPQEAWGQKALHKSIHSIKSLTAGATATLDGENGQINISHANATTQIDLEYILVQDFKDTLVNSHNNYRPIIQDKYMHVFGHSLLAFPSQLKNTSSVQIQIKWDKSFKNIVNSFNVNKHKQKFITNYNALSSSVFCSGDFKIKKHKIFDAQLYVAHRGTWIQMSDTAFNGIIYRTVYNQRKFWKDNTQKFFLITAIPLEGKVSKNIQGEIVSCDASCGGTALTNSFASFFTNNVCIDAYKFAWIFNHELMHNWIGLPNGIPLPKENEELAYWFSEGFTDYFAYKSLVKNGFADIKRINSEIQEQIIQPHYASVVKSMPNDSIKTNFWKNNDYQKLPYRRGFLIAWYLDISIRKKTNDFKSLDDFVKDMASSCKSTKETFNMPKFERMLNHFLGEDMSVFVKQHIIDGIPLDLENKIVWPGIKWIKPSDGDAIMLQLDENNADLRRFFYQ